MAKNIHAFLCLLFCPFFTIGNEKKYNNKFQVRMKKKKLKLLDRKATLFCELFCHLCCQHFFFSLIEETEVPKTFGYKILPISPQNRSKRVRRPKLSTQKPKK